MYICILGIRNALLESEENECPDCHGKEISPETLIPNRYLRNAVNSFKDKTGYSKRIEAEKEKITPSKDQAEIAPVNIESTTKESKLNIILHFISSFFYSPLPYYPFFLLYYYFFICIYYKQGLHYKF